VIVGVPLETWPGERRVALVPDAVRKLCGDGPEVVVERAAGAAAGFEDAAYEKAGARLEADARALLGRADVVLKVQPPRVREDGSHEVDDLAEGGVLIGFLRPLDLPDLARRLARRRVTAFSMELMPRITRAQSMDALSAMATLAGYRAVLIAAEALPKIFPMMTTAAGTIAPSRVFVIGAGVAGLQAIATAKRLGAVVEAYDTRPAVKEQVQSLGARFVELEIDTGDAEDAGGYARAQSEEFYQKQRQLLGKRLANADVVVTTALVPGQRAPLLIPEETVQAMRPGSVIVDLAAEQGGNCELSQADRRVTLHDVTIMGPTNLPSDVPSNASQMYSKNLTTFLGHLMHEGSIRLDLEDEITRGAMLCHEGEIVNERARALAEAEAGDP
jgi:NAD(P) transhydrogenase subunit alpha